MLLQREGSHERGFSKYKGTKKAPYTQVYGTFYSVCSVDYQRIKNSVKFFAQTP